MKKLAALSGVSRKTIDNVEAGQNISVFVLKKLLVALGVDEITLRVRGAHEVRAGEGFGHADVRAISDALHKAAALLESATQRIDDRAAARPNDVSTRAEGLIDHVRDLRARRGRRRRAGASAAVGGDAPRTERPATPAPRRVRTRMRKRAPAKSPFGKTFMRSYDAWLRDEERAGEEVAASVAALDFPPATVEALAKIYEGGVRVGVARMLTARSHGLININPKKAAALALLAARVAEASACSSRFVAALGTARGEAWMRYAAALFEIGNFPLAHEAAETAETYFQLASPFPPAFRSAATLGLIHGKILHFLGETERGLLLIEQSAKLILCVFDEPDKYAEAMTIYNAILMHAGRFEEAAQRWEEIAALAREKGDLPTLAHVVNNVGRCHLQIGRTAEARECFATALELFEQLQLRTQVPEVRLNLAYLFRQEGRYSDATLEMYKCRAEFAKLGMLYNAAEVCIRIVETRLIAGRTDDLLRVCREAVEFFETAGLPEQARRAADYLLEGARTKTLSLDAVREVCVFLTRLRDAPEEQFRLAI